MTIVVLALIVFGLAGFAPPEAGADSLVVTVADDSVTVQAADAALTDVLIRVGKATSARVLIESVLSADVAKARVTTSFTELPMDSALRRLLQGRNFVLVYGSSGVDEIRVYVDGKTGFRELGAPAPGRDTAASENTSGAEQGADLQRSAKLAPPPPRPPDDPAKVARLRQTALSSPDVTARVEALEELAEVEDTKLLVDTLVQALGRERDSTVLGTVLDVVGQQKDAVPTGALRAFASSDRDGPVRVQALELLAERAGSDQSTRAVLQTLSKTDASPEVREAAQSLLDDLRSPRVTPSPPNPSTARPPQALRQSVR